MPTRLVMSSSAWMPSVPSGAEPYELIVTAPARRAIERDLPEAVAGAVIEFITGSLLLRPWQIGRGLKGDLKGVWSARRGTYRVLYRIDEERSCVVILRIDHRKDIYRT